MGLVIFQEEKMPTYTLMNTETGEVWDEFFTSYSAKDEYLTQNKNIRQKLTAPKIVSQVGGTISKTPDSWKEHLGRIKKGSGRGNTINK